MENGIYTRREYRIILYENDSAEPFVVVENDKYANHNMVLQGDTAEGLILAIAAYLDIDHKENEGS